MWALPLNRNTDGVHCSHSHWTSSFIVICFPNYYYYCYYYYYYLRVFHTDPQMIVPHWILSNSISHQVTRTLLSDLEKLTNALVWMVLVRPYILKLFSPFISPLGIVPRAPVTITITITFMFNSYFFSFLLIIIIIAH